MIVLGAGREVGRIPTSSGNSVAIPKKSKFPTAINTIALRPKVGIGLLNSPGILTEISNGTTAPPEDSDL